MGIRLTSIQILAPPLISNVTTGYFLICEIMIIAFTIIAATVTIVLLLPLL